MGEKPKILIVEDEIVTARSLEKSLQFMGFEVVGIAADYNRGIDLALEEKPDLVLLDIRIKGEYDGITLAQRIQAHADIPIIYLTAHADTETVTRAVHTRPYNYLVKPYTDEQLNEAILDALARHQAKDGL
jgi:DNA-binding NtrC family response regulator